MVSIFLIGACTIDSMKPITCRMVRAARSGTCSDLAPNPSQNARRMVSQGLNPSYGLIDDVSLAMMEAAIYRQQDCIHGRREYDEQERHGHDHIDVVEADRIHQQIAEAALRSEHFAEYGADQGQREADADAGENFRHSGREQHRAHHEERAELEHAAGLDED